MPCKMINLYESKILTVLIKRHQYWNTAEISKKTGISWNTVEKYLEEMHGRGWLEKKGRSKILWKAILPKGEKNEK